MIPLYSYLLNRPEIDIYNKMKILSEIRIPFHLRDDEAFANLTSPFFNKFMELSFVYDKDYLRMKINKVSSIILRGDIIHASNPLYISKGWTIASVASLVNDDAYDINVGLSVLRNILFLGILEKTDILESESLLEKMILEKFEKILFERGKEAQTYYSVLAAIIYFIPISKEVSAYTILHTILSYESMMIAHLQDKKIEKN